MWVFSPLRNISDGKHLGDSRQDQLAVFQETPQDELSRWIYHSPYAGSQPIDLDSRDWILSTQQIYLSLLAHINQLTKTDRKSQFTYVLVAVLKTGMLDGASHSAKIRVRRVSVL